MTTERIDVLAVFDAELGIGTGASLEEIKLARAAVAELIEAANVAGRAMESMTTLLEHYRDESLFHKRLDAWFREYAFTADQVASALARVGGAS